MLTDFFTETIANNVGGMEWKSLIITKLGNAKIVPFAETLIPLYGTNAMRSIRKMRCKMFLVTKTIFLLDLFVNGPKKIFL